MSLSLDSTNEVKVVKTATEEVKDLSLDSTANDVDFSELSEYCTLLPKEFLTAVDGRDAFTYKHKFGDAEVKNLTLKTKSCFISNFVKEAFDKEKTAKEVPVPNASKNHLEYVVKYLVHQDGVTWKSSS